LLALIKRSLPIILILTAVFLITLAACNAQAQQTGNADEVPDGDPERGVDLLIAYGCNSCHTIPNVTGATSLIGPPLIHWRDRHYIVGMLINTPENTMAFIMNPQSYRPGTAMINMDVTAEDARDMTAYLYTLTRDNQRSR
jgi:cytochrome c2